LEERLESTVSRELSLIELRGGKGEEDRSLEGKKKEPRAGAAKGRSVWGKKTENWWGMEERLPFLISIELGERKHLI